MKNSILKKFYFSPFGSFVSKICVPIIRKLKSPHMLWGYMDSTGVWRQRTRISDTVFFYHKERIYIEDNVFVWHYSILDGTGGLEIGTGSQIGAWVGIFTHSSHITVRIYGDHYHEVPEDEKIAFFIEPVRIGKYVFIGASSIILPGVTIGDGALVSAGSMVTKNIAPFQMVAGRPAQIIGNTEKLDKEYLQNNQELNQWYLEWKNSTK